MVTPLKNYSHSKNFSISNTFILNNFSIQNFIIAPKDLFPIQNLQNYSNNYFSKKPTQKYFSPTPKNNNAKKEKLISYPTSPAQNKFGINYNYANNIVKSNLENKFKKTEKKEKNPEDSRKNLININARKINNRKIISQKMFRTFKKPKRSLTNNLSMDLTPQKTIQNDINLSKKKIPRNVKTITVSQKNDLNLKEFFFEEKIGKGTFGHIFSVKWNKNNKYYAMKKEILKNLEDILYRKKTFKIMQNFQKNTGSNGIINLYGNLSLKKILTNDNNLDKDKNNNNNKKFIYYELMEKAERDWDNEIYNRSKSKLYYTEKEIINIMTQLIRTLSLLQKNHITHRDIKPQNILIFNKIYKLSDFGEIRVLEKDGLIVQRVRGSELYMSPILFHGLHNNLFQVKHNTYKSDVFSLGMCLFYATSLTYSGVDSIREVSDMEIIKEILFKYLNKRYSKKLILFILSMLEVDESKRNNFVELEEKLKKL